MKIYEMIEKLSAHPKKRFKSLDFYGNRVEAYIANSFAHKKPHNEYFGVDEGIIIVEYSDGEKRPLKLNGFWMASNWDEVEKSITLDEAIKSCMKHGSAYCIVDGEKVHMEVQYYIKGKNRSFVVGNRDLRDAKWYLGE